MIDSSIFFLLEWFIFFCFKKLLRVKGKNDDGSLFVKFEGIVPAYRVTWSEMPCQVVFLYAGAEDCFCILHTSLFFLHTYLSHLHYTTDIFNIYIQLTIRIRYIWYTCNNALSISESNANNFIAKKNKFNSVVFPNHNSTKT